MNKLKITENSPEAGFDNPPKPVPENFIFYISYKNTV